MGGQSRFRQKDMSDVDRSQSADYPLYVTPGPAGDIQSYGAYSVAAVTGIIAAGASAASEIFQFRWAPTTSGLVAVVRSLVLSVANLGTAFAAGGGIFNLMKSTANTVAGSGGGTLTMTTANGKLRTSHAVSQVAEIRVATTGALTAATQTQLPTPLGSVSVGIPNVAGHPVLQPYDFCRKGDAQYPIVLANQEGLQIEATVPGTGTWTASVHVVWDELGAYPI